MTDILITDTHFGIKQNSITWFNSQSNFIYKQLIPYIEDHKDVVRLIHLGDVFDSRSSISVLIAAKVKKIFTDLARVCGQVIVIGGNHDYYSPNSNEYNSIELVLGDVPGITLVTRDILIDGSNMYVPWYEYDVGVIETKVREFNIKNVFVHNDIVNGDIPNINARLFSGHIHSPLFRTNKGLYNLGSCCAIDFSDCNSERGFYELSESGIKFIPNNYSIRFWRLFNEDIFKDHIMSQDDYIEMYISQSNMATTDYVTVIDKYIKQYKNIWLIPQISSTNSVESIKFEGYDIEKVIEESIPSDLKDKFNQVINFGCG